MIVCRNASEEAMGVSYAMRFMTYRQEWLDMMVRTGILREQIFLDGAKGLGSNFIGMTKTGKVWCAGAAIRL